LDREIPVTEHFTLNRWRDVAGAGSHPADTGKITTIRRVNRVLCGSCIREFDCSNGPVERCTLIQHLVMQATLVGEPASRKHEIGCGVTFDVEMGLDPLNHRT
jgi:hypothetical protein